MRAAANACFCIFFRVVVSAQMATVASVMHQGKEMPAAPL